MSSRGLIWSTSKSLGFFLLITADQALSRFSLFKSAFNVSLMSDVPPIEDCDLPRRGAAQQAALWSDVAPWGHKEAALYLCWSPWEGDNGEQHLQLLMPVVLGAIWVQQWPLKPRGEREPLGLAGSHLPTGESAGLCPRAHFTTSGALKKDLSNFKSISSHISSSYLKKWTLPTFWGYKKAYLSTSKLFFQPAPCACNSAVFQCFWAPVSIQAVT